MQGVLVHGKLFEMAKFWHPMKRLLSIFILAVFVADVRADSEFNSYYAGERYQFTLTDARQAQCPQWNAATEPNPPYEASKALAQAKTFIAGISTSTTTFWKFEALSLMEVSGGWVWRARHTLASLGPSSGNWPSMDCWILMDGTVMEPKVTKSYEK